MSFIKLTPSLRNISASSVVIANIAAEVQALFSPDELPGLRYRVELIREVCIACKNHSDQSNVQLLSNDDLVQLICKVHTQVFGAGDTRDDLYLAEVVGFLIESGQVTPCLLRRIWVLVNRIFR